ncbi:MAG: methionine aminotransferase [Bacteroidetes bacterium GWF2_42_66]|nr:MAG: methionine aminotransferase [Bacteroidetes bacterium GWA2_42_15]OFX98004.1 MAG: methionine aminotransferase [Bacteroidetes bacterium GWE2_42_39]OFY45858.1 MAG: methionine aminotransferase [Bacteroidetes bacterium GWF2_42_66]
MVQSKMLNNNGSIFSQMNKLTDKPGIIDMAVGKSEFPCPPALTELASKYIRLGYNNFAPMEGIPELRSEIATRTKTLYGYAYNPETEINITAGHIQTVTTAISSVVKEDDEVIVFEPAFESYVPAILINGGRPKFVSLKLPDFHIDWEELRKMISSKTRMIIVNSPHNPTGAVLSDEDMVQLQRITNGTNIVILSDEIFESFVYDNKKHQSVARYEKLAKRSFIVSSFGPAYNVNGWGIACCLAPENLMRDFRNVHQFQVFNANTPLQYALAEFISNDESYLEVSEIYQGKRNYFKRLMVGSPFGIEPTQGSYFQLLNYSDLSNEKDTDFALRLLNEYGLATIPLSAFFHEKTKLRMVRLCFAKTNETLEKASEILKSVKAVTLVENPVR